MKTREKALDNYITITELLAECRADCMEMGPDHKYAITMCEELALLVSLERVMMHECVFVHEYKREDLCRALYKEEL